MFSPRFKSSLRLMLAAALIVVSPALRAQQASSNVAVVSIAPLDRLLKDTSYLLRACNIPEMGGLVSVMANQYTQGMDRSRPMGALVSLEQGNPGAVVFMPMIDRQRFFGALAGMGIEPDELGDGLFEIDTGGQTIFVKDSNGWMYISQLESSLNTVPVNPAGLLGKLPEQYDLAIRINLREIPQPIKDQAVEQIRIGYERSMAAQQTDQTAEEREAADEIGRASIEQLEQLISDTEQIIFGWNISGEDQKTYFDGGVQFVEGSKLAEQAEMANSLTSDYTDFNLPSAAAKFRFSSLIAEGDRAVTKNSLSSSMAQLESQLDNSGDLPETAREMLRDLLSGLGKILEQTIDEGVFDGAGSFSIADETLRVLVGGRVADGNALAAEFKKAAANVPDNARAPKFEFDYETYQGISLHRITVPTRIADPAAKRVLGDQMLITIGTGEKNYLIALDPSGDAAVKAAIDRMANSGSNQVTPFEGVVELGDILRFAQAVSPNSILDNAVNVISQYADKDKLELSGRLIPRGGVYRISIDEGILRAAGAAAKGAGNGGGGF